MPKVGKKHYPYTHAGRRAAKEAAKKKGLKVEYTESTYERIAKLLGEASDFSPSERRRIQANLLDADKVAGARRAAHAAYGPHKDDDAASRAFYGHLIQSPKRK